MNSLPRFALYEKDGCPAEIVTVRELSHEQNRSEKNETIEMKRIFIFLMLGESSIFFIVYRKAACFSMLI